MRENGAVDHLWIRVGDLAAARAWYEALAVELGLPSGERPQRFHVRSGRPHGGTFGLVADGGPPTRHAHLALAATGRAVPGTRLDPDGNRVELVARPAEPTRAQGAGA